MTSTIMDGLTPLSVAFVGILGTQYLEHQQGVETNVRVYADLMSRREQADSDLRKDMFKSILDSFLTPGSDAPEQRVLKLELLAYNFHESLDLSPLFKQVYAEISTRPSENKPYLDRLSKVASEVTSRQIGILAEAGASVAKNVDFEELSNHPEGIRVLDQELKLPGEPNEGNDPDLAARRFRLEVLYRDPVRKELRVRLQISPPGHSNESPEVDTTFWIDYFDFPMIDNTRITHGQRCAAVLTGFEATSAEITLVYFPGSRASLKEKPYYDEVIHELLRTGDLIKSHKGIM